MDQTVAAGDSLLSGYTDMLASTQNMMSQSTAFQRDMNNMKMAYISHFIDIMSYELM